ncbi:MAG: hypothetical protein K0R26_1201 [Bacteroidota bacterium]|jgi:hypothetical protein|nr:hypothetical protein [Bacteroidota bacterium]
MKNNRHSLIAVIAIVVSLQTWAQTVSFDTFTLSPNSYYQDNSGADFSSNGVTFQYDWNSSWNIWESGSAYTNVNDTVNGTYTNLYGCITGTAFSGNNYATVQSGAKVIFSNTTTAVSGFYITNTTYAWKEIKKGGYGRKFGDTTGTGSGASIPQGEYPDWFKVLVRGFRGGNLTNDSVQFFLADFRGTGTINDYVVKNWQYVNCLALGQVDSIQFIMKSSDNNSFGMKTPAFFSIDNLTTVSTVDINEIESLVDMKLQPNPAKEIINLNLLSKSTQILSIVLTDISGKELEIKNIQINSGRSQESLDIQNLDGGIYFLTVTDGASFKKIKFIKL